MKFDLDGPPLVTAKGEIARRGYARFYGVPAATRPTVGRAVTGRWIGAETVRLPTSAAG